MTPATTATIRVVCQRASSMGWVGWCINKLSGGGGYGHALIVVEGKGGLSSYPDGGVQWLPFYPSSAYTVWSVTVDADDLLDALAWAEKQLGSGYDFRGDAAFIWPFRAFIKPDATRWFCSEIVVAFLQQLSLLEDQIPAQVSPNGLAKLMVEAYGPGEDAR